MDMIEPSISEEEVLVNRRRKRKFFVALVLVALLLIVLIIFALKAPLISNKHDARQATSSHILIDMPYVGLHNNTDRYRYTFHRNDVSSAIISNLARFGHLQDEEIRTIDEMFYSQPELSGVTSLFDIYSITTRIHEWSPRYDTAILQGATFEELVSEYLNENSKTPILVTLPLDKEYSKDISYHPLANLIGIDFDNELLTFNTFWRGPHYQISFNDFYELQSILPNRYQNLFLAISLSDSGNPSQSPIIDNTTGNQSLAKVPALGEEDVYLYTNMALAQAATFEKKFDLAAFHYERTLGDKNFDQNLTRIARVLTRSRAAYVLRELEEYDDALEIALTAVSLNYGLDRSEGHFASYQYLLSNNAPEQHDRISIPHLVLGDIYADMNEVEKSREQYEIALRIYPYHTGAQRALESSR